MTNCIIPYRIPNKEAGSFKGKAETPQAPMKKRQDVMRRKKEEGCLPHHIKDRANQHPDTDRTIHRKKGGIHPGDILGGNDGVFVDDQASKNSDPRKVDPAEVAGMSKKRNKHDAEPMQRKSDPQRVFFPTTNHQRMQALGFVELFIH